MNRYYIDTNILIFIAMDKYSIHRDVMNIMDRYDTQLYTSTVCVQEMIHLYQIGKLSYKQFKTSADIFTHIEQAGIKIVPVNEKHLKEYARLPLYDGHSDPNDQQNKADKYLTPKTVRRLAEKYVVITDEF